MPRPAQDIRLQTLRDLGRTLQRRGADRDLRLPLRRGLRALPGPRANPRCGDAHRGHLWATGQPDRGRHAAPRPGAQPEHPRSLPAFAW